MSLLQKIRTKISSFREDRKYFGLRLAARNLLLWGGRKLCTYRAAIVYVADVPSLAGSANPNSGLRCDMEPASGIPQEILQAADIHLSDCHEEIFVARKNSQIAFVAKVGGKSFTIPRRHTFTISERGVYISCCYTTPGFRGQGIYGDALKEIARLFLSSGEKAFLYVEFENEASIRSVVRAGFLPIGRSVLLAVGPFRMQKFVEFSLTGSLSHIEKIEPVVEST